MEQMVLWENYGLHQVQQALSFYRYFSERAFRLGGSLFYGVLWVVLAAQLLRQFRKR